MLPLFFVYFSEYAINQGVSPTIYFSNSPFTKREHYVYFQALYQLGVFISRSSVNIFPIKKLWILPILQLINLVLLISQAIYHFIPNIWIIFCIIFYEGLLGGATYVNAFYLLSQEVQGKVLEFSLSITSIADTIGISLAGLVSIFLEPWLLKFQ